MYFCSMKGQNSFLIGDKVTLVNDTVKGVIKAINSSLITIVCDEGFEMECRANELVRTGDMNSYLDQNHNPEFTKKNSTPNKNISTVKAGFKKNRSPAIEIDLHIHHLVKSNKGMTNYEMLSLQLKTAKRELEFAIHKKTQRIVFIHGIGEGVLRSELYKLLKKYPVEIYEASYDKYGQGATEVYIYQNT